jgi:hypothetical protein
MLDILPTGVKFTSEYFCSNVIDVLASIVDPEGRKARAIRYVLHFDNAPVHKADKVQYKPEECDFHRLEHLPYSPDLSPCDFVLFDHLHEKMQFLSYHTVDELEEIIT